MSDLPVVYRGPVTTLRRVIGNVGIGSWFGPNQPVAPQAPPGTPPRQLDYPVGWNLNYIPRADDPITFAQLRDLAVSWDLLALVIETRKDQVAGVPHVIRPVKQPGENEKQYKSRAQEDTTARALEARFKKPDGELLYSTWIRKLIHEVLVVDALTIWPDESGLLQVLDGGTIKKLIDIRGNTPKPPDPAYQQIIKGMPASNFTRDELLYRPRNIRADRLYGYSPVEQIIYTVNLAIRRSIFKLGYYTEGNMPEAIIQLPESWPIDKIKEFAGWWNSLLAGQDAVRRQGFFIPGIGGKDAVSYPKQDALKDEMDEWLARVVCYAFSVSPQPFIREMNRATAETSVDTAKNEGLAPLLDWLAEVLTDVIQTVFDEPDYEWSWSEDAEPDPLKKAQIQALQIERGIKSPDEIAEQNGDEPVGVGRGIITAMGFVEFKNMDAQQTERLDQTGQPPKEGDVTKRMPSVRQTSHRIAAFLAEQGKAAAAKLETSYARALERGTNGNGHAGHTIQLQFPETPAPVVHVDMSKVADIVSAAVTKALTEAPTPILHHHAGDVHVAQAPITVEAPQVTVKAAKAPDVNVTVEPKLTAELTVPERTRKMKRNAAGEWTVTDQT